MRINRELCINCGLCIPYCPVDAIAEEEGEVKIIEDECTECNACIRAGICPRDALFQPPLNEIRKWRALFSDTLIPFPDTGVAGRGTDEVKTNDVTDKFKRGYIGFGIEVGRPGIGVRFSEVEKISKALVPLRVTYEKTNPMTALIDKKTGAIRQDIINEKVISVIIEFIVPQKKISKVMAALEKVSGEIDTVFALELIQRTEENVCVPMIKELEELGYFPHENSKVCIGLGHPLKNEKNKEIKQ